MKRKYDNNMLGSFMEEPDRPAVCKKCGSKHDVSLVTIEVHGDKPFMDSQRNNWVKPYKIGWRCSACAKHVADSVKRVVCITK